jgi:hypothetical protein
LQNPTKLKQLMTQIHKVKAAASLNARAEIIAEGKKKDPRPIEKHDILCCFYRHLYDRQTA